MDARLEQALDFSNYMITLSNQRRVVEESFVASCVYYQGGGCFTVTRELINFVNLLVNKESSSAIILDDNNLPVQIDNLEQFFLNIFNLYTNSLEKYFKEYTNLKKTRSVEGLVK